MKFARAFGYVWSAPYGLLGLLAWLLFRAAGAKPLACGCPLALDCSGLRFGRWMASRQWAAFTLAWTILVWDPAPDDSLLVHEGRHVSQALVLGALYPVAYLACWAWCWLRTWEDVIEDLWHRRPLNGIMVATYRRNWFERDARRAAGEEP